MVKKAVTKKADNLPALTSGSLSSAEMSKHLQLDNALFKDVKLDVLENKELFKNDFLIPKLWLIQAMSELRKENKALEGQYVDSQTAEVLCDTGDKLNIVVLKTFKRWHTFELVTEKNKTKEVFVSSEIMVLGKNESLPYQETVDGKELVRRQVISAYVLLERDVKKALNKPYIIDFAKSSKGAGRKLVSDINTLNVNNYPAFVAFFTLGGHEETFTDGSAYVKDIAFGGYLTNKDLLPFLVDCYKNLITMEDQIEIDDRDIIKGEKLEAKDTSKVSKKNLAKDVGI